MDSRIVHCVNKHILFGCATKFRLYEFEMWWFSPSAQGHLALNIYISVLRYYSKNCRKHGEVRFGGVLPSSSAQGHLAQRPALLIFNSHHVDGNF